MHISSAVEKWTPEHLSTSKPIMEGERRTGPVSTGTWALVGDIMSDFCKAQKVDCPIYPGMVFLSDFGRLH